MTRTIKNKSANGAETDKQTTNTHFQIAESERVSLNYYARMRLQTKILKQN